MSSLYQIINQVVKFISTSPGLQRSIVRSAPHVVREIDKWISSAKYEEAKYKVREIEQVDASRLKEIYNEHYHKMSPGVRRAFEEALRRRGES